jgi:hypothetical protein
MIQLAQRLVTIQGKEEKILSFEVWFQTPWGLIDKLDDAVARCVAHDIDPNINLVPVSVAITETNYEVIGR